MGRPVTRGLQAARPGGAWGGVVLLSALLLLLPGPAQARTLEFCGLTWTVRSWPGGPGNGNWSDAADSVWVDASGLHLTTRNLSGVWHQTEVVAAPLADYGTHRFYVNSRLDLLDPNVVSAAFLYADDDHEIDIEVTRGFDPAVNGWHVVQAVGPGSHHDDFLFSMAGSYSTHRIDWSAEAAQFRRWAVGATTTATDGRSTSTATTPTPRSTPQRPRPATPRTPTATACCPVTRRTRTGTGSWSARATATTGTCSSTPGAPESCDTTDSDCDGSLVDEFDDFDGDSLPDCPDDDFDGDGLGNADELLLGTDPTLGDTDGDGLSDGDEVAGGTDPLDPWDPYGGDDDDSAIDDDDSAIDDDDSAIDDDDSAIDDDSAADDDDSAADDDDSAGPTDSCQDCTGSLTRSSDPGLLVLLLLCLLSRRRPRGRGSRSGPAAP